MTISWLAMCWHQKTHLCFLLDLQKEANKCQPENYNIVHNFLKAFINRSTPPSQQVGRYAIHRPFSFPARHRCKEIHRLQQQRPKFTGLHCKATCPRKSSSHQTRRVLQILLCAYIQKIMKKIYTQSCACFLFVPLGSRYFTMTVPPPAPAAHRQDHHCSDLSEIHSIHLHSGEGGAWLGPRNLERYT